MVRQNTSCTQATTPSSKSSTESKPQAATTPQANDLLKHRDARNTPNQPLTTISTCLPAPVPTTTHAIAASLHSASTVRPTCKPCSLSQLAAQQHQHFQCATATCPDSKSSTYHATPNAKLLTSPLSNLYPPAALRTALPYPHSRHALRDSPLTPSPS